MGSAMFSKARVVANMAREAFSRFTGDGSLIVETDREGPRLAEIARKAVLAGMVAVTAFTAVAPAVAATVNMPGETQVTRFLADANESLSRSDGVSWFNRISGVSLEAGDRDYLHNRWVEDPTGDDMIPLPGIGRNCIVHYAPAKNMAYQVGYSHLNLDRGFDLTRLVQWKGIAECVVRSQITSGDREFAKQAGEENALGDIVAVIAAAKYGKDQYKATFGFETSQALGFAINSSGRTAKGNVVKLEALGQLHAYIAKNPSAFERTDIAAMPDFANALLRHAEAAVARSGIDMASMQNASLDKAQLILGASGLKAAGHAAKHAADTGLVDSREMTTDWASFNWCNTIQKHSAKRTRQAKSWCNMGNFLSGGIEQVNEPTVRFGKDAESYITGKLADTILQVSAVQKR